MQTNLPHKPKALELINFLTRNVNSVSDRKEAEMLLKITLHSLRESVSADDAIVILCNLPTYLKPIYNAGWKFSSHSYSGSHIFSNYFQEACHKADLKFIPNQMEHTLKQVGSGLRQSISTTGLNVIKKTLPEQVSGLLFS